MSNTAEPKNKGTAKSVVAIVLAFIANYIFFFLLWILDRYDNVQFDQILYQIKSPVSGTDGGLVGSALAIVFGFGTLLAAAEVLLYLLLSGKFKDKFAKFKGYTAYCATRVASFFKKHFMPISAAALTLSILFFIVRLDIHGFVADSFTETDFIEQHYVNPENVNVSFEGEKRNLIYIFLESMECTFSDTAAGGKVVDNFIPELTELAEQNVSFSKEGALTGAYTYIGSRWTAAAMFAQTSGLVLKVPLNFDIYGNDGIYMPGITALGDILKREGYNQTLLVGSDSGFAARDVYFTEHGNYNIVDIYTAKEENKLPQDYWEFWGYEDRKLFDFAKEEITELAAMGEPFNFTTLTVDTHFPNGYKCPLCENKYEEQYANVYACSSRQVYEFVEWIKAQDFYENTTIVLAGDHLTMDRAFPEGLDENYVRTTYNCIINPAVEPVKEKGREFATFDMFPTTLAALGATIEGNKLALGVNLFSEEKTLTEIYGYERLEEELQNKSEFYLDNFYQNDEEQ